MMKFLNFGGAIDFYIKSYDRLKFCHANFWKLQIYHSSLQSEDSSIKYTLNQVPIKKKLDQKSISTYL